MTDDELETLVCDLAIIAEEIKRRVALVKATDSIEACRQNLDAILEIANQLSGLIDVSPLRN